MHKYAIQITVADTRDKAVAAQLKEASSWGKVDISKEQMFLLKQLVFYHDQSMPTIDKIGKREIKRIFKVFK